MPMEPKTKSRKPEPFLFPLAEPAPRETGRNATFNRETVKNEGQ